MKPKNRLRIFFRDKIAQPSLTLLRQGTSPTKLALTIVLGLIISIFPVIGTTTILCTILAVTLKLNLGIIQSVNWLAYPLQILLLVPFIELGITISDMQISIVSAREIKIIFDAGFIHAIQTLWKVLIGGIIGWAIVSLPVSIAMYFSLRSVFQKITKKTSKTPEITTTCFHEL